MATDFAAKKAKKVPDPFSRAAEWWKRYQTPFCREKATATDFAAKKVPDPFFRAGERPKRYQTPFCREKATATDFAAKKVPDPFFPAAKPLKRYPTPFSGAHDEPRGPSFPRAAEMGMGKLPS